MPYDVSEADKRGAKIAHEVFLTNLIVNHILLFAGLMGMASSMPLIMLATPSISVVALLYIMLRARIALKKDSWFVMCHWQLTARRARFFITLLGVLGLVFLGLLASVGWDPVELRPGHKAIGGVAMLPTLVTILVLIVMESDAQHKARSGIVPDWLVKKFPNADVKLLDE